MNIHDKMMVCKCYYIVSTCLYSDFLWVLYLRVRCGAARSTKRYKAKTTKCTLFKLMV